MLKKWLVIAIWLISSSASATVDIDSIIKRVRNYAQERLTRAYCMIKRDCHQRIIYVMNLSEKPIQLSGCKYQSGQSLSKGQDSMTHQKNSDGGSCQLTISKEGEVLTEVVLNPKPKQITYIKQAKTECFIDHRVVKSWKKCPWGCGKYDVWGYVGGCLVGN